MTRPVTKDKGKRSGITLNLENRKIVEYSLRYVLNSPSLSLYGSCGVICKIRIVACGLEESHYMTEKNNNFIVTG